MIPFIQTSPMEDLSISTRDMLGHKYVCVYVSMLYVIMARISSACVQTSPIDQSVHADVSA
jgi:hypothetical protein